MASSSTTLFLIFNILFFSLTQCQETTPSPAMNSTVSPPPAMNTETSPPPAMNSTTSSPPPAMNTETSPPPAMNSTTSSPPPAMNTETSPPPAMNSTTSSPPPRLNCSGCRVNPIGLASCGVVISGGVVPPFVRLCCRALQSLTREEGIACLCNVINRRAFDTGNFDIRGAVDKVLNICSNI